MPKPSQCIEQMKEADSASGKHLNTPHALNKGQRQPDPVAHGLPRRPVPWEAVASGQGSRPRLRTPAPARDALTRHGASHVTAWRIGLSQLLAGDQEEPGPV